MIKILGIDPGSVITGFGLLRTDGVRSFHVEHGHWSLSENADEGDFNLRLGRLHNCLSQLIEYHRPDEIAVEKVFLGNNAASALKLGQARGAAIGLVVSRALPVFEYAPRTIKQAVVGSGAANKLQVSSMMEKLLSLKENPQADAADALAVALCHSHSRGVLQLHKPQSGRATPGGRRRSVRWKRVP